MACGNDDPRLAADVLSCLAPRRLLDHTPISAGRSAEKITGQDSAAAFQSYIVVS